MQKKKTFENSKKRSSSNNKSNKKVVENKEVENSKKRTSSKNKSNKKVVENKEEITERVIAINSGLSNFYTTAEYDGTLTNYFILISLMYSNKSWIDKSQKQIMC